MECSGQLVITGGDASPLLQATESPFDDISASGVLGVERRWPASALAAIGPGGIGLIAEQFLGAGACSSWPDARDPDPFHQRNQHRSVVGLAG